MSPQGISIHVAVNRGDRKRPAVVEPLASPADNAKDMERIAKQAGFRTTMLVGPAATCAAVTRAIREAAGPVGRDGILLLTYSGHGSLVPDAPGPGSDEGGEGKDDQTWCLYDDDLVDDELYRLWAEFEPGARIVVISDSCYGGGMIRTGELVGASPPTRRRTRGLQRRDGSPALPHHASGSSPNGQALAARARPKVAASVLLLAAAGKRLQTMEHGSRGRFTAALLDAWQDGAFRGSYLDFHKKISASKHLIGKPKPIYDLCGVKRPGFEAQRPFTITPPPTG